MKKENVVVDKSKTFALRIIKLYLLFTGIPNSELEGGASLA